MIKYDEIGQDMQVSRSICVGDKFIIPKDKFAGTDLIKGDIIEITEIVYNGIYYDSDSWAYSSDALAECIRYYPEKETSCSGSCENCTCEESEAEYQQKMTQSQGEVYESDPVNHPNHYTQGKIECISYILDKKFSYLEGNIIKYITRYKHKNGLEDLKKAQFYLNRLIEQEENNEKS